MNPKVLVLNMDYSPITICTVQRAFLLVFLEKADLISKNQSMDLHTVSASYPMPSVIKLKRYINIPYRGVMLSRDNIFKRDGYKCLYCGSKKDLTLDHVLPKARGGKTTWNNLATACKTCNSKKGDFMPEEAEMKLPYRPFKPSYVMFLREFSGYDYMEWKPFLESKNNSTARAAG